MQFNHSLQDIQKEGRARERKVHSWLKFSCPSFHMLNLATHPPIKISPWIPSAGLKKLCMTANYLIETSIQTQDSICPPNTQ